MTHTGQGGSGDITALIQDWQNADAEALAQLLPHVVEELHRLASHYLSGENASHTLQPTALVNEVYVRLVGNKVGRIDNRSQFFAFSARLMRQILIDYARARRSEKRGGDLVKEQLEDMSAVLSPEREVDVETLLALDEALEKLAQMDPRRRSVAEMRYFGGLTFPEIAEILGVSLGTVERDWMLARRFLAREIQRQGRPGAS